MATMNVSLPDELKEFIDRQVAENNFMTSSEYIRSLVRKEHGLAKLREMVAEGLNSGPTIPVDDAYFMRKRERIRNAVRKAG